MLRIGPKMDWALQIIRSNPGRSKLFTARQIAPHAGSGRPGLQYGYNTVNRLIRHGLVTAIQTSRGYQLTVKED